jgi:hypothetical protein
MYSCHFHPHFGSDIHNTDFGKYTLYIKDVLHGQGRRNRGGPGGPGGGQGPPKFSKVPFFGGKVPFVFVKNACCSDCIFASMAFN